MKDMIGRDIQPGDVVVWGHQVGHMVRLRRSVVETVRETSITTAREQPRYPWQHQHRTVFSTPGNVVIIRRASAPGEEARS